MSEPNEPSGEKLKTEAQSATPRSDKSDDELAINRAIARWTAGAAIVAALSAALSAGSTFIAKGAAEDTRDEIARNDAPALFLDCTTKATSGTSMMHVVLGDDVQVYETFHKAPDSRVSHLLVLPPRPFVCTLSNAGKLPATNIRLVFDVYYADTPVFGPTTHYFHDFVRFPDVTPDTGTVNLAPGDRYSFIMWNTTVVTAWVSPRWHAEIDIPTIGPTSETQCVPIYLSASTLRLTGVSPSPRKPAPAHSLPYDVPKLARMEASTLKELAPTVTSQCLAEPGFVVKGSPSPSAP
jgi:hypothetical protein